MLSYNGQFYVYLFSVPWLEVLSCFNKSVI